MTKMTASDSAGCHLGARTEYSLDACQNKREVWKLPNTARICLSIYSQLQKYLQNWIFLWNTGLKVFRANEALAIRSSINIHAVPDFQNLLLMALIVDSGIFMVFLTCLTCAVQ